MAPSLSLSLWIAVAVRLLHHFSRESLLCCQFPDRAVWAQRVPLSGGPPGVGQSMETRLSAGDARWVQCVWVRFHVDAPAGTLNAWLCTWWGERFILRKFWKNNSVFTRSARGVSDQAHVWFKRPSQLFFFFLLSYAQFLLFHMRLWFFLSVIFPPVWSWHHQHLLVCRIRALVAPQNTLNSFAKAISFVEMSYKSKKTSVLILKALYRRFSTLKVQYVGILVSKFHLYSTFHR